MHFWFELNEQSEEGKYKNSGEKNRGYSKREAVLALGRLLMQSKCLKRKYKRSFFGKNTMFDL